MRQKLFAIEDIFNIVGRGIVIVGEAQANLPPIKLGDAIVLILPDGTEISADNGGVDRVQTVSGNKKIGILIRNLTKAEIPVGTIAFLTNSK
jgi:translation elongation factor EF-Tu-like GTPase